jgi:hypothetical protein
MTTSSTRSGERSWKHAITGLQGKSFHRSCGRTRKSGRPGGSKSSQLCRREQTQATSKPHKGCCHQGLCPWISRQGGLIGSRTAGRSTTIFQRESFFFESILFSRVASVLANVGLHCESHSLSFSVLWRSAADWMQPRRRAFPESAERVLDNTCRRKGSFPFSNFHFPTRLCCRW